MPGPLPSQTGRHALTDVVHLIAPTLERRMNKQFTLHTPVTKVLRRRGTVKRQSRSPSPPARGESRGAAHSSPVRPLGAGISGRVSDVPSVP